MFSARDDAVVTELSPRRMDSHRILHRQEKLGAPGAVEEAFLSVIETARDPPRQRHPLTQEKRYFHDLLWVP